MYNKIDNVKVIRTQTNLYWGIPCKSYGNCLFLKDGFSYSGLLRQLYAQYKGQELDSIKSFMLFKENDLRMPSDELLKYETSLKDTGKLKSYLEKLVSDVSCISKAVEEIGTILPIIIKPNKYKSWEWNKVPVKELSIDKFKWLLN